MSNDLDKFIGKPISNVLLGYNEVKSLPNIIGYLQIRHIIFFPVLAGKVMYGCNTIVKNVNNTNLRMDVHNKYHLRWYHRKIDEQHQAAHQFLP